MSTGNWKGVKKRNGNKSLVVQLQQDVGCRICAVGLTVWIKYQVQEKDKSPISDYVVVADKKMSL